MKSYKQVLHEGTPSGIIEDAVAELQSLGEELQEWADSMPENLQSSDKYNMLTEAADTLTQVECNVDEWPDDNVVIKYYSSQPKRKNRSASRVVRLDNANAAIQAVIDFYNGLDRNYSELIGELEELVTEVEIPSQFG